MRIGRFGMSLGLALGLAGALSAAPAREDHEHEPGKPEELGRVHFPVSCGSRPCEAAIAARFERAVAMLHSFWYEKAEEEFRGIAAQEPSCALAWWGVAMCRYHPLWAPPSAEDLNVGREAVEKARAVAGLPARDRAYIEAIGAFYDGSATSGHAARRAAYAKAMEKLHADFPEDREATAFDGLALLATATPEDKTYAVQKKAASLLEPIFREQPDHPGASHYLIHALDSPALASLALPAARNYAKIAPSVPHALHMPSHIFTRLGLWQDSIESNRASAEAARRFEREKKLKSPWDEELHALDYLLYAALQIGKDSEADAVAARAAEVSSVWPDIAKGGYALAAISARPAMERGRWDEAARIPLPKQGSPADLFAYGRAMVRFARAVGAARSGDAQGAAVEAAQIAPIRDALARDPDTYWRDQTEILRKEAEGWASHAAGKDEEAVAFLTSAAAQEDAGDKRPVTPGPIAPAREQLGELLLEIGRPAQALRMLKISLESSPNRWRGLAAAFRSARRAGDGAAAALYARQLAELGHDAEKPRPELREAQEYLAGR